MRSSSSRAPRIPSPLHAWAIVACIVATPAAVFAQAAIAGAVADSSGAWMPDVLVTVSSTALIESTRSTVTDNSGTYRVEDLRPGVYTVTFSRDGWKPLRREGVELVGSFTARVDADLSLDAVAETVTVTRAIPLIDARTVKQETVLSGELVRSIPAVRTYNALLVVVPGIVTSGNDTVTAAATTQFPIHGGRTSEGRLAVDGLNIGSAPNGNSATSYAADTGHATEVTFTTAGGLGDVETAGVILNIVPSTGGNVTERSVFAGGTGEALESDNLTDSLRNLGVTATTPLRKVYDLSAAVGGPIVKSRAWYFVNGRTSGSTRDDAVVFYNLNAGDPAKWLYAPDTSRREYSDRTFENASGRLTWQLTPRNKIGVFWDEQVLCRACTGATAGLMEPARVSPEAVGVLGRPLRVAQATWRSPVTNTWYVEAGFGGTAFGVGNFERRPNPTRGLVRVVEQCASGCAANGGIPGLVYRSQDFSVAYAGSYLSKTSISHVRGSHTLKFGYQHTFMTDDRTWMTNDQNLTYRVNNGVVNQLTESISPWVNDARAAWDAVFAQAQWTHDRLSLQGALRFDRARSWFPPQQEGPSRFLPTPMVFERTAGVDSYKDVTPRVGAAYDVFGDGKTALKVYAGKYLDSVGVSGTYANANPTLRLPQTTPAFGTAGVTRAWTDANGNFVPDCDLFNPGAQDLRFTGGDLCGAMSNMSFGRNTLTNNFDPSLLDGWGVRPSDWDLGVSVHQQVSSRASVSLAYTRRWFHGLSVVDNLALTDTDLTPFELVAPRDSRLPGGGGYVISGLYDVVPNKSGEVRNMVVDSSRYGAWSQYSQAVDVNVNVRNATGFTLVAGTSTGQTVTDACDVRAHLPEFSTATTGTSAFGAGLAGSAVTPLSPYCHVGFGVLTQFKGLAAYVVPRANVQISATFQSKPGAMLAANYVAPNAEVRASLGRDSSGNAPNVTVNLVAPGSQYGDRINQLDARLAKAFTFRNARSNIALEVYNALNSSAALAYSAAFTPGSAWPQPLSIVTPRFVRVTAEFDF